MNIDSRRHEHTSCVPEGVLGATPGRGSGSDREPGPRLVAEGSVQRRMVSVEHLVPWVKRRRGSGGVVAGGERDFANPLCTCSLDELRITEHVPRIGVRDDALNGILGHGRPLGVHSTGRMEFTHGNT